MVVCESCGTENPDGFAFCGRCGTKIEAARSVEQRRLCTIVFCDLVGFTQRSESLDPEDVRQFLLPYYELMTDEVERYGGAIDKLYGDGAMAVFGVPITHEDDPERAIRASLRVLERLPSLGLDLQARIGINTGEVVVSTDHAARGDALTGDTVNTASRVQSAAPVGGVVVGELTYQATKPVFDYDVLEPVELKGKAEPVAIFRPLAPIAAADERAFERTPFVGRDAEIAALVESFDRARRGEPTFLTIVAEPGMGKSRLIREFARYVDDRPELVTWRQGRCLPYGEGISLWALGEIVKTHAGILDTDDQTTISRKLDAVLIDPNPRTKDWIKDRLAPLVGLTSTTAAPERGELFSAWRRFFTQLAAEGPLVMVIEDLHWADDALVAFLEDMRRSVADVPILLLATARPEVAERAPDWLDGTEIRLQALGDESMLQLVGATMAGASGQLIDAVCERSGGSPLYAEQLAAMRRMMPIAGWSDDDLPIPPTIQALLGARLDMLTPELLSTLLDASVVGKTFWTGAVAMLGEVDAQVADERLAELARREFIREDPSSTIDGEREYSFVHALLHDVAYGRLSRRPRLTKHRSTADWIVDLVGRPMGDVAEIVVAHLDRAKEAATAAGVTDDIPSLDAALVDALSDAATNAKRTDLTTASRLIERAVALLSADDRRRPELLYGAAEIANNAGDLHRALELLDAAIPGLREMEQWDVLGQALTGRGSTLMALGDDAVGHEVLADAADELASHPGHGLVAVLSDLAWFALETGVTPRALELLERTEHTADAAGIPRPPVLLELRASLEIIDGEVDLGYRHWREAAERALADGDAATAASILNDMGSNQTAFGTLAGAIAACDEAVAIIEERGLDQMFVRSVRTATLMSLGRWDEVVAETPGWIQVADDMGNVLRASGLWVTLAQVLFDRGRPDLIDQDRFEPADFPRRSDPRPWAIHLRLQALRGDVDLDVVSESIEARQLWRSPSLMAVLIELGAVGLAERYRELFNGSITAETWAEGLLRIGRGEWPQADAALGATLDGQRAVGSKYSEADLLTWLGRSAIGLGVQELARERLTGARELWVSMGAAARIAEVDDLLDAI